MENITVIIPIHKLNEKDIELTKKAIQSVLNQTEKIYKICVVYVEDEIKEVLKEFNTINFLKNDTNNTDFCSQVNFGVSNCETEWFSVLEFDDEFSDKFFKNVSDYFKSYTDVSMFLPIVVESTIDNKVIKFTNEAAWAKSFVGDSELGIIEHSSLLQFPDFSLSGAIIKKSDYIEVGMLKNNIKISFIHEFLLRFTNNTKRMMVIPKIGYLHRVGRENSLLDNYKKEGMTQDEVKYWLGLASKEFYFKKQREVNYQQI
jgi:hypothetical protein